jgi:cytochrome b561
LTARVTDWGLAALIAALLVTGVLTLFAGPPGAAWIFAVHDACGIAVAFPVVVKLRRGWQTIPLRSTRRPTACASKA